MWWWERSVPADYGMIKFPSIRKLDCEASLNRHDGSSATADPLPVFHALRGPRHVFNAAHLLQKTDDQPVQNARTGSIDPRRTARDMNYGPIFTQSRLELVAQISCGQFPEFLV